MNPLLKMFGGNGVPQSQGTVAAPAVSGKKSLVESFREFKSGFSGNPEAEIKKLVDGGKVTMQQVDLLTSIVQMAGRK